MRNRAKIHDGVVSSITILRLGIGGEKKVASFNINSDGVAEIRRIFTDKPEKLKKAMHEVLKTEYADEVIVFSNDDGKIQLTHEAIDQVVNEE